MFLRRRLINNRKFQDVTITAVIIGASIVVCLLWYFILLEWENLRKILKAQMLAAMSKREKVHVNDPDDLASYVPAEKKDRRERAKTWKAGDMTAVQQGTLQGRTGPPAASSAKNYKPKKKKKEKGKQSDKLSSVGGSSYLEVGARKSRHAQLDGRDRLPPLNS
jgi:hypothetical protein